MAKKVLTQLDLQSNKIINLATPTASTDAATKAYADSLAGNLVASFTIPGTLLVSIGAVRWYAPKSITITSVIVSSAIAPQGAAIIFDVNRSGTTIFGTQANRPTISINATNGSTTGMTVTSLTTSDYITIDVDQVGSTFAGSDAVVQIVYT